MVSPLSVHAPIRLAPVLLMAMVWQVGACPCGCVDHNLWLEMVRSFSGGGAEKERNTSTTTVDAHDCDHRPRDSFLRARTAGEDGESVFVALHATLAGLSQALVATSESPSSGRTSLIKPARFSDAQEMRAHLQVYRI